MDILGEFQTTVRKALDEINPKWESYKGLIVCGTHRPEDPEAIIDEIKKAREKELPFLGICFGHQLACVEHYRNVIGIEDATSEEFGKGTYVVTKRKKLKVGFHNGESYWSSYKSKHFPKTQWQITTPYHPEYQSSKENPHPILVKFLKLCSAE